MTLDERGRRAAREVQRATEGERAPWPDPIEDFDRFRARKLRNRRLGVGVLVVVLVVPILVVALRALQPPRAPLTPPAPPPGMIVVGNWHPGTQLADWFTIAPDGSDRTDLHVSASCVEWWPGGAKLLITNDAARSPGHPLRPATLRPDGTGLHPLDATKDPDLELGCGDVSSDGRRLVLEGFAEPAGVDGIYTVRASDGGGLVRLTDGADAYPQYAPDDSRIVFFRTKAGVVPDGAGALFVMDADGTQLRRITPWGFAFLHQAWSPDANWIVFQKPYGELWLVHPDGSGLHRVPLALPAGAGAREPTWSPDSSWIVFSLAGGGEAGIAMVHPDGTDLREVVDEPNALESEPNWGPQPRS